MVLKRLFYIFSFRFGYIQSESIKTQHFSMVHCFKIRGQISMYMIWLGRVILSNYFDTTFDEYCFTDDVTGAGIVTE